jgi:hypothetical protein
MKFKSMVSLAVTTFTLSLAFVLPAQAQSVSGQGTWETTLLGRDINRKAVAATDASAVYLYDTTLQVTWLRNASALGYGDWNTVNTRAANLVTGSGGNTISDWRLPTMTVANPNSNYSYNGSTDGGHNVPGSSSEMASLFYNTLGNLANYNTSGVSQAGFGLTNAGSFQNMQSTAYWLGTEYAPNPSDAWYFYTGSGFQTAGTKFFQMYALAVRPGDVSPAPEPETYLMLLMGLGLVGAMSRRRARTADLLRPESFI